MSLTLIACHTQFGASLDFGVYTIGIGQTLDISTYAVMKLTSSTRNTSFYQNYVHAITDASFLQRLNSHDLASWPYLCVQVMCLLFPGKHTVQPLQGITVQQRLYKQLQSEFQYNLGSTYQFSVGPTKHCSNL